MFRRTFLISTAAIIAGVAAAPAFAGSEILLYVKTLTGKTIRINIEQTASIADLKAAVQDEEGIPPEQQRLIFNGKQLDNEKHLVDYNITNEATVYIVLRLRGG